MLGLQKRDTGRAQGAVAALRGGLAPQAAHGAQYPRLWYDQRPLPSMPGLAGCGTVIAPAGNRHSPDKRCSRGSFPVDPLPTGSHPAAVEPSTCLMRSTIPRNPTNPHEVRTTLLTTRGVSGKNLLPLGAVAQLGERLNGIQEVRSSILLSSTRMDKGATSLWNPFSVPGSASIPCRVCRWRISARQVRGPHPPSILPASAQYAVKVSLGRKQMGHFSKSSPLWMYPQMGHR